MNDALTTRWNRIGAAGGAVAWLILGGLSFAGVASLGLLELLFLSAPLVLVPLGLQLIGSAEISARQRTLLRAGSLLQPFGAALAALSFLAPTGETAAWIAGGWLLAVLPLAAAGVTFPVKLLRDPIDACFEAGLLYLPIGAVWLVITRLGATPMELGEPIILPTAVHFHFSGFALACITGATGRSLETQSTARRVFQVIALGIIGGTFLIAIGFLASPGWKYAAIGLFYCNLLGLAGYVIAGLSRVTRTLPRILLCVSSGSLAIGMTLALIYAAGEYSGDLLIDIPGMALWHGPINGIGFTLCALLGWVSAEAGVGRMAR